MMNPPFTAGANNAVAVMELVIVTVQVNAVLHPETPDQLTNAYPAFAVAVRTVDAF